MRCKVIKDKNDTPIRIRGTLMDVTERKQFERQIQTANVVLLPSYADGTLLSSTVMGAVPIGVAGLTSAVGSSSPVSTFADGGDHRTTITISGLKDAVGQSVPDGTAIATSANFCFARNSNGGCIGSAGGQIIGASVAPFDSSARIYTVTNGQIVFPYSSQGVSVATGSQTATVQVQTVTPQGGQISSSAVATIPVQLLSPGSAVVAHNSANPCRRRASDSRNKLRPRNHSRSKTTYVTGHHCFACSIRYGGISHSNVLERTTPVRESSMRSSSVRAMRNDEGTTPPASPE